MNNTQSNYRFLFLLVFSALMVLITRGLMIYYGISLVQYIVICMPAVLTALVGAMLLPTPINTTMPTQNSDEDNNDYTDDSDHDMPHQHSR